ncbi:MAG TPA: isochorismatase family protein [Hellea balneolensis]|uniref:Isochorismatase family protein n=1 Tax=Hellea balneolensis TaxID=287478 RepID=A0A7V5NXK7_9PROT|nr:isochorismatase family protein [Hellea balneolensis]
MPDLQRTSQTPGQRPALIVVDMINGFTDPACPLGGDYPDVIAANQRLLAGFRKARLPVFFTTVVYTHPDQARVFRARLPALNVLTPDSDWVKIDERLARRASEPVIAKHWASGFFKTNLASRLHLAGADSLVVSGLTTSGCVRATALDGLQHDYKVFVPREACGDRNPDAHRANLFDLHAKYADVVPVDDIIRHLKGL